MFTGLIEEVGTVHNKKQVGDAWELTISAGIVLDLIRVGDSISINGACQTVSSFNKNFFTVFVSKVTSQVTTLGTLHNGSRVNLERALTPVTRMGGHFVQGHIDGRGRIIEKNQDANGIRIRIKVTDFLTKYIVNKGSIAVDGISLTVVEKEKDNFLLYVIPETIKNTTIPDWDTDRQVNIEVDIIAKYIENFLLDKDAKPGINNDQDKELKEKLLKGGFI